MSSVPELSIIIVNWNSREFLRECLRRVFQSQCAVPYEVIVVDNASYDGSEEMLRKDFPETIFVQAPSNLGFARGNNLGVTFSNGRLLLFLNPDTEIEEHSLQKLVSAADASVDIGIVGARLINSDGTLQFESIKAFPTLLNQLLESHYLQHKFPLLRMWGIEPLVSGVISPTTVDVVSGACLLVKRDVFASIGGFCTQYFMYSEDVDLCWRARKLGRTVVFAGQAEVVHHGGGSSALAPVSQFSAVLMRESRFQFFKQSRGEAYALAYRITMTLSAILRLILLLLAFPFLAIGRGESSVNSIRKWWQVLRWTLGLEPWVKKVA